MNRGLLRFVLALGALTFLLLMMSATFAQDDPYGVNQAVEAAQTAASSANEQAGSTVKQAAESASSAQPSARTAAVVWLFSPLSIAIPAVLWWLLLTSLLLCDGFFLSSSVHSMVEKEVDSTSIAAFIFQMIVLVIGLSWLGIINPALLVIENRQLAIKLVLIHIGAGVVVSALKGLWDLYFKYYQQRKEKLRERVNVVRASTLEKLKLDCEASGSVFDDMDPAVKDAVRKAVECDPERQELLKKIRVRDYAPHYALVGAFWEPYLLWKFVFQYLKRWAEVLANIGQVIADFYNKKLHTVGLED